MKNYKVKTKVISNFNDSKNAGKSYEKNDENKKLKCFLIDIKFCSLNAL